MQYSYKDSLTGANLLLSVKENHFTHAYFSKELKPLLTMAWNRGPVQSIFVDGESFPFSENSFVALAANQTFSFEDPTQLIIWQFDKPFYCIEDNDHEVSCIGFLFWSHKEFFTIMTDENSIKDFDLIFRLFMIEFQMKDNVQNEMLRALLKRMILNLNNLAKKQELNSEFKDTDLDIIRQFNVLVEKNFRKLHQVQDYANLLNKSPKTLTNLFSIYNNKSPLEVIHERIMLEAKRLLIYTDSPVKEIAWQLGFEEVSNFSRMFKNTSGSSPVEFKVSPVKVKKGKIDN